MGNKRKALYLLILGLLPLFFVVLQFYSRHSYQSNLSIALDDALESAEVKEKREFSNTQVKKLFSEVDHFYIDKEIEKIALLKKETERLQKLMKGGYHPDEDEIKKQYQFLTGPQNKLSFTEGSIKSYKGFQETMESLSHPVEVNLDDLQNILGKVEGVSFSGEEVPQNRPHLIITECKLERKKGPAHDVFTLDLKVLKREYLK
jgi:hypothetical protein